MDNKAKKAIRGFLYFIAFGLIIACFIYLGEKYASNSKDEILTIKDYYKNIDNIDIEPISGTKFINMIKKGDEIIIIGSHTSKWSEKYIEVISEVLKEMKIKKAYYYDLNNDKSQKNSNYYKIIDLLEGSLTETDAGEDNLLAPSLYIIDNNEIRYYDTETVAMPNNISPEEYWNKEQKEIFKTKIKIAIEKYYLNN